MTPKEIAERLSQLLDALESKADDHWIPVKGFLSIKHAAEYCDLSEESIRRLCASGMLTPLRPVKGRILIDRSELDAFIRSCDQTPRTGRGRQRTK